MKKKYCDFIFIIVFTMIQFIGFVPHVNAEDLSLTTDEHGLVGYGFAPISALTTKESYYVYGRISKDDEWTQLASSATFDDAKMIEYLESKVGHSLESPVLISGWGYGFFADDEEKTNSPIAAVENTEVYDEVTGLYSKLSFSFHDDGKLLKVNYTVINKSDTEKKFGLWSGGDTTLAEDDGIPIVDFAQNGIKGFYMYNDDIQFNIFSSKNDNDIDFWYGSYEEVNTEVFQNFNSLYGFLTDENGDIDDDSCAFWHWENQTIPANSSKNYAIYIGLTTNDGDNIIDDITNTISNSENESGKIQAIQPTIPNINNTTISNSSEELTSIIPLTENDQSALADGKNISVYLEVTDISNSIDASEKEKIDSQIEQNDKIGMYLDVNLFKKIDGESPIKITELNNPMTISFEIPEELINKDSNVNRVFNAYVLHNGEITKKEVNINDNIGKFETDKFSTYVLTYNDTEKAASPATGDNILTDIVILLVSLGSLIVIKKYTKSYKNN